MRKFWKIFLLFFLIGFQADFIFAVENSIAINEIAWMGTKNSANDEWIELFNKTGNPLSLKEWVLKADDNTPEIKLSGKIPANGFYLLERTDDNTLPEILADQIYKGALENNGENLKLYDNFGNLIDEVNCQDAWSAGENKTKQTMERKEDNSWQTSQNPGGTPKAKNSEPIIEQTVAETITETQSLPESLPESLNEVQPQSFTAAAVISIFSGLIILFLKKGLKNN